MPSVSHVEFSRQAKAPQPTWRALFRQRTTSAGERGTGTTLPTHRSPLPDTVKPFTNATSSHAQLQPSSSLIAFRGEVTKRGQRRCQRELLTEVMQQITSKSSNLQLPKPSISHIRIKREAISDNLWLDGGVRVHPNLILIACIYSSIQSSSNEGRSNEDGPMKSTGW